jgi:hypothetical protein
MAPFAVCDFGEVTEAVVVYTNVHSIQFELLRCGKGIIIFRQRHSTYDLGLQDVTAHSVRKSVPPNDWDRAPRESHG